MLIVAVPLISLQHENIQLEKLIYLPTVPVDFANESVKVESFSRVETDFSRRYIPFVRARALLLSVSGFPFIIL